MAVDDVVVVSLAALPLQDVAEERGEESREVFFRELSGFAPAGVYRWETLRSGHVVSGPAVIEAEMTSALVPPEYTARVDGLGNLLLAGEERR